MNNSDLFQTTKEQRANLLIKANILDKDGYYVERFFSADTIKKDKKRLSSMEYYVKNTHQSFLNSIKMAEQMQILGNGALAGKTKK